MTAQRVVFLDRDGTLVLEPDDQQIDRIEKVRLVEHVIPSLLLLQNAGYSLVMVTNQDGLGTDSFPEPSFRVTHEFLAQLFASQGIYFAETFVCPHAPADGCTCRKPKTGLVDAYLQKHTIDLERSAMVGDRETDLQFANAIGVSGFLLSKEAPWPLVTHRILALGRTGSVRRTTKETDVTARVSLEENIVEVHTGIGFFDHMLEQVAHHGGFSLSLSCRGDLHIDEHHTVEDCALALGQALREALGNKRGIGRYGFVLPMDEAEARVSLDLSGRAFTKFEGSFPRTEIGGLPTELVSHFFRSVADALGASLHINVTGENTHHMVESCFKGFGRALRMAIRKEGHEIPSSKGVL